jgi:hypothetical protein
MPDGGSVWAVPGHPSSFIPGLGKFRGISLPRKDIEPPFFSCPHTQQFSLHCNRPQGGK